MKKNIIIKQIILIIFLFNFIIIQNIIAGNTNENFPNHNYDTNKAIKNSVYNHSLELFEKYLNKTDEKKNVDKITISKKCAEIVVEIYENNILSRNIKKTIDLCYEIEKINLDIFNLPDIQSVLIQNLAKIKEWDQVKSKLKKLEEKKFDDYENIIANIYLRLGMAYESQLELIEAKKMYKFVVENFPKASSIKDCSEMPKNSNPDDYLFAKIAQMRLEKINE